MNALRLTVIAAALSGTVASATPFTTAAQLGPSITIADGNAYPSPSGANWYTNHEDNETEYYPHNALPGQGWDLEGMYLKDSILTLVGGFNFNEGMAHGGKTYRPGDLFIDVTGDIRYTHADNAGTGTSNSGAPISNSLFNYDYVVSFKYSTGSNPVILGYDIFALDGTSLVKQVTDIPGSNAWRYHSGGRLIEQNVLLGNGQLDEPVFSQLTTFTGPGLSPVYSGLRGDASSNVHNYISLNLSFLHGADATFHYTMECGNDNLMGRAHVSETGSSILLVLGGLSILGVLRRRK